MNMNEVLISVGIFAGLGVLFGIHHGNTVHHADRIKLTSRHTGAKSDTAVGASLVRHFLVRLRHNLVF